MTETPCAHVETIASAEYPCIRVGTYPIRGKPYCWKHAPAALFALSGEVCDGRTGAGKRCSRSAAHALDGKHYCSSHIRAAMDASK